MLTLKSITMKTTVILVLMMLFNSINAQKAQLPDVSLRTLSGRNISASEILKPGEFTILVFWKTEGKMCCENIESIQNAWSEKLKSKGIRLVGICVDCVGGTNHVQPYVAGRGWTLDTYIDVNGDFKRMMNVQTAPYTILFDKDQKPVCRYEGFCSGSEELLCNKILSYVEE